MPQRFFIPSDPGRSGIVEMDRALAHHLTRTLRMRAGDSIVTVDPSGFEHCVRLRTVTAECVDGDVVWSRSATGEPTLRVSVVQALPRERMDDCVDVLVEAGAAEVRPVITERVVSRADAGRLADRAARWQTVAREAAQLAGRGLVPRVHVPVTLADALAAIDRQSRVVACTFDGGQPLAGLDIDRSRPVALCIGPEGGFGPRDLEALRDAGAETVHLGARVLRTRYAGAIACALLLARAGDLDEPLAGEPRP